MIGKNQPKVFISYSHDSEEHMNRAFSLSERLRDEGVDCQIDQYEISPVGGWPRWTRNRIKEADFVLVVCTKSYERRYEGTEKKGTGAGAKWEGAIITQQLYEAEGGAHKFIPVVFSPEDTRYIPVEIRGATFYILDDEKGYEDLYRHITGQPKALKGKLGKLRSLPPRERKQDFLNSSPRELARRSVKERTVTPGKAPKSKPSSLVLIMMPDGNILFVNSVRVEVADTISLRLLPADNRESAQVDALSRFVRRGTLTIAFSTKAIDAQLLSVKHIFEGGGDVWDLQLQPDQSNANLWLNEYSLSGQSVDEIAELRARRILLDEKLFGFPGTYRGMNKLNQSMLEHSVQSSRTRLVVTESPFPKLYAAMKQNTSLFLEAARLYAVLLLLVTNTVVSIHQLELRMQGKTKLAVRFEGQRQAHYSNEAPPTIKVQGVCDLIKEDT